MYHGIFKSEGGRRAGQLLSSSSEIWNDVSVDVAYNILQKLTYNIDDEYRKVSVDVAYNILQKLTYNIDDKYRKDSGRD